jgi:hypothetical protein
VDDLDGIVFFGYVDTDQDGVLPVDIRRDGEYVNVWISDNLADQLDGTVEDFISEYGSDLYEELEDYRSGNSIDVRDVWPV